MDRDEDGFAQSMFDPSSSKLKTEIEKEEEKRQQILDEYNMKALNKVVNDNEFRPVNILRLNFLGAEGGKYREPFLKKQLEPLLEYNKESLTMGKLLKNIDLVNLNFLKSDSVSNIGCQLTLPENNQFFNMINPDILDLVINMQVIPVKKFFLKIGTNVGNGEGDGYVKLQWKNIFGGGESLDFDTNISSNEFKFKNSKSQYLMNYSSPIFNNSNYKFNTILYHSLRSIDFTSYHNQSIEGITLKASTNYLPIENKLNHEISFENLIRCIDLKYSNNEGFRNNSLMTDYFLFNSGYNFKSSITYSIIKDCRDSKYIFDKGYYVRLSNEISLFSNNKFIKSCFDYSKGYKINSGLLFNLNLKMGLINSLTNDLIHPMDKFQLGGSNDIKGWLNSGMGPKQMNMNLGGNYFHAIGLNLFSNVPYFKDSNFKFHYFINIGKLTNKINYNNILKQNCISSGFGISYNHPMAAFELNWVVPISANFNDDLRRGLQWGIGISFL